MKETLVDLILDIGDEIGNLDSFLNENFRPITQVLDNINLRIKYGVGIFGNSLGHLLPNEMKIIHAMYGFYNLGYLCLALGIGDHKGYRDNGSGNKIIDRPGMMNYNYVFTKTRVFWALKGTGCVIGSFFTENQLDLFLVGLADYSFASANYIIQSDDDEPKFPNHFFSRTRKRFSKSLYA